MSQEIRIVEATHNDLKDMIHLRCEAAEDDILTRFLYGHRHVEAVKNEGDSLTVSLGKRFTHPTNRCHIVKAVETSTLEMVGWCLIRWEDGSWVYSEPPQTSTSDPPTFSAHYAKEVKKNWREILGGKPHVVLGAINVRVDRQKQGVGRKLVEYMYSKYSLDDELVVVQTRGATEEFYSKLGWIMIKSTDIDLSEWGGKGVGYGVHRSPQMLRYPQTS